MTTGEKQQAQATAMRMRYLAILAASADERRICDLLSEAAQIVKAWVDTDGVADVQPGEHR